MSRYQNIKTKNRYDGKKVYRSVQYPVIPNSDTDILIIAKDGDYLDTLAYKYYKDSTLWWIIANVNNVGKGRLSVTPGTQLRIPTNLPKILNEFNKLNQ